MRLLTTTTTKAALGNPAAAVGVEVRVGGMEAVWNSLVFKQRYLQNPAESGTPMCEVASREVIA